MTSVALVWPGQAADDFLEKGAARTVSSLAELTPDIILDLIKSKHQLVENK